MSAELVFITGATGFIGSQTVNAALRAGFRVRLSIRNPDQANNIKRCLAGSEHKVETIVIPELTKEDAFRSALTGVDYVFHLASPMPGKGEDVRKDYVEPAVDVTLAVLKAAARQQSIKAVVVESSVLALIPLGGIARPPVTPVANTNERLRYDLNMDFPEGFQGHGLKYTMSKMAAHQAVRDFRLEQQPLYKIFTFHPVFVLGHSLIQQSPSDIDGINAQFWKSLALTTPTIPSAWVSVEDVAEAHVRAIQRHEAIEDGTEFIISAPVSSWQVAADLIRKDYPEVEVNLEHLPSASDWQIDTSPADRLLGMKWHGTQEIVRGVIDQQLALSRSSVL